MNIVACAKKLLHTRLVNATKVTSRCVVQAHSQKDFEKDFLNANLEDNPPIDGGKAITLDPNWKKWWDGSFGEHPGKYKIPPVRLPKNFEDAASLYLKEFYNLHPKNKVLAVCGKLCDILAYRPLPKSVNDLPVPNKKPGKKDFMDFFYGQDTEVKSKDRLRKLDNVLWKQMVYDKLLSAAYLIGRTPGVYASTVRVLNEIKRKDPDFEPKAMLDYGSGTGTALWAAHSLWGQKLEDYFCVDWSHAMNEIARYMLTGGSGDAEITGIYLRQALPVSFKYEYDIVTAAYTLSELPSEKERLTTLKILWEKTKKYLVIIERGEQQGYQMIMEARNLISKGIEGADPHKQARINRFIQKGHIFSPCPHIQPCPKWKLRHPCHFRQSYHPPTYAKSFFSPGLKSETFSYIILSKEEEGKENWPRVVADPHYFKDKVRCHLCAPDGQIHHLYMKKLTHERSDIRTIARKASAGDSLPYDWQDVEQ